MLFLSIFVASYQFVCNGFALSFALMGWVNPLRVCMDVVPEKTHQNMEEPTYFTNACSHWHRGMSLSLFLGNRL